MLNLSQMFVDFVETSFAQTIVQATGSLCARIPNHDVVSRRSKLNKMWFLGQELVQSSPPSENDFSKACQNLTMQMNKEKANPSTVVVTAVLLGHQALSGQPTHSQGLPLCRSKTCANVSELLLNLFLPSSTVVRLLWVHATEITDMWSLREFPAQVRECPRPLQEYPRHVFSTNLVQSCSNSTLIVSGLSN